MWLLERSIFNEMQAIRSRGFVPSPEQLAAHAGVMSAETRSRIMTVVGDVAEIEVRGVLTDRPDFFAFLLGGGNATYSALREALIEAQGNPEVSRITLNVDSPGGTIAGLFDTLAVLENVTKPIEAVVGNMAASAAYAIVSAADSIRALNPAALFGSVGTAKIFSVDDSEIIITSDKAPKKIPDVTTEEGVATVREELNAMHEIFVEAIAKGRGVSVDKVNAEFGQGAVLLAGEALKRGMIDAVKINSADPKTGGNIKDIQTMNIEELQAKHSDLYAAVFQKGVNAERDRVTAHLTMGDASGDMVTAISAVSNGDEMTATLSAKYMAAGLKKNAIAQRDDDDVDADPGEVDTGDSDALAKAGAASILAMAAEQCGLEAEA